MYIVLQFGSRPQFLSSYALPADRFTINQVESSLHDTSTTLALSHVFSARQHKKQLIFETMRMWNNKRVRIPIAGRGRTGPTRRCKPSLMYQSRVVIWNRGGKDEQFVNDAVWSSAIVKLMSVASHGFRSSVPTRIPFLRLLWRWARRNRLKLVEVLWPTICTSSNVNPDDHAHQ